MLEARLPSFIAAPIGPDKVVILLFRVPSRFFILGSGLASFVTPTYRLPGFEERVTNPWMA